MSAPIHLHGEAFNYGPGMPMMRGALCGAVGDRVDPNMTHATNKLTCVACRTTPLFRAIVDARYAP